MANIQITTTTAQDKAAQRAAADYNAEQRMRNPAWVDITTLQWFTNVFLPDILQVFINRYSEEDGQTKAQLYQKASDADKATIDGILAKYAG